MKIHTFEIPDKLLCRYALMLNEGGVSRIKAHQAIFDHAIANYKPFKNWFKDDPRDAFGPKLTIESAQEFLPTAKGDIKEICLFTIELDRIVGEIHDHPTASQRHMMERNLDADDYLDWGR